MKPIHWQAANFGAALGRTSHHRSEPAVRDMLLRIHMALGEQMALDYDFRRFDETRCGLPMSELLEETKHEWSRR